MSYKVSHLSVLRLSLSPKEPQRGQVTAGSKEPATVHSLFSLSQRFIGAFIWVSFS